MFICMTECRKRAPKDEVIRVKTRARNLRRLRNEGIETRKSLREDLKLRKSWEESDDAQGTEGLSCPLEGTTVGEARAVGQ